MRKIWSDIADCNSTYKCLILFNCNSILDARQLWAQQASQKLLRLSLTIHRLGKENVTETWHGCSLFKLKVATAYTIVL